MNGGLGAMPWPPKRAPDRAASRLRRGAMNEWGFGGHVVAPKARARQSRVTASPGRGERLGVWGPCRGPQSVRRTEARHGSAGARRTFGGLGAMSWPPKRAPDRAASRLRRGAANVWGFGGHVVAPKACAGQSRVTAPPGRGERWGVGGHVVAPQACAGQRRGTAPAGRGEGLGGRGACRGPDSVG